MMLFALVRSLISKVKGSRNCVGCQRLRRGRPDAARAIASRGKPSAVGT